VRVIGLVKPCDPSAADAWVAYAMI